MKKHRDSVLVKNFILGSKWKKAKVDSRMGPVSHKVVCEDGVTTW